MVLIKPSVKLHHKNPRYYQRQVVSETSYIYVCNAHFSSKSYVKPLLVSMVSPSSSSSCSSSCNWSYDVFPSFSGEDVHKTFLSHFLKELDGKLIIAFKENEIDRSLSIGHELMQAIRDSRIAVVVFSQNYASSTWCLNELLKIVKCKKDLGQLVIPIFYRLDPTHVRKQTGDFGDIFNKTCEYKTEDAKTRWRGALTDVVKILGYHIVTGYEYYESHSIVCVTQTSLLFVKFCFKKKNLY